MNGVATDAVPVEDRGLHYGDGLFETIALKEGQPLCVEKHFDRLSRGCSVLGIALPHRARLHAELDEMARHAEELAVVKLMVTRGSGARGYAAPIAEEARRIFVLYPWPSYPVNYAEDGAAVCVCKTRLGMNPALAGLKHLNRLEQVLARSELIESEFAEGLMLNAAGSAIEGTMSNLFAVRDGELFTPDLSQCGVEGVVRGLILELAAAGSQFVARVERIDLETLWNADEIFLCNSLLGVWPVTRLSQVRFSVGPVTRYFQQALERKGDIVRARG